MIIALIFGFTQGVSLSLTTIILNGKCSNIYVEHIENCALDSYFLKHVFWGRYMDDVISLWNYGGNELRGLLDHLNT
jgi:hypothetical protein